MHCPDISHLPLSDSSRKTIERIKSIPGLANELAVSLSAGKLINIFAAATPAPVTINSIEKSDWHGYIDAMASIPIIARSKLKKEAHQQWINAQFNNNVAEARFWEAVADGCKLP